MHLAEYNSATTMAVTWKLSLMSNRGGENCIRIKNPQEFGPHLYLKRAPKMGELMTKIEEKECQDIMKISHKKVASFGVEYCNRYWTFH